MTSPSFSTPQEIAAAGHSIYNLRYRVAMEADRPGDFIVIDVTTEAAYPDSQPEGALDAARLANPKGIFHLVRIGAPGAFRVSYALNAHCARLLQTPDTALQAESLG